MCARSYEFLRIAVVQGRTSPEHHRRIETVPEDNDPFGQVGKWEPGAGGRLQDWHSGEPGVDQGEDAQGRRTSREVTDH